MISMKQPNYEYVQYISLNNIANILNYSYNISNSDVGENIMFDDNVDIFVPNKEELERAKERYKERIKKGTTKNYNRYFKKLMRSFNDIRNNE